MGPGLLRAGLVCRRGRVRITDSLICELREGVQIMVYCALIVSLLITLWTGRKPAEGTLEMIQLYFKGWADLGELEAHIEGLETMADSFGKGRL